MESPSSLFLHIDCIVLLMIKHCAERAFFLRKCVVGGVRSQLTCHDSMWTFVQSNETHGNMGMHFTYFHTPYTPKNLMKMFMSDIHSVSFGEYP